MIFSSSLLCRKIQSFVGILVFLLAGCSPILIIPAPPQGADYAFEAQGSVEFYGTSHELIQLKGPPQLTPPPPTFLPGQSLKGRLFNPYLQALWEAQKLRAQKRKAPSEKKEGKNEK